MFVNVFSDRAKENVLTYRGEAKALELMAKFDRDSDGKLDYTDFRGYLSHFNRLNDLGYVMENREAFSSYMYDLYGTDKKGKITKEGFLNYRKETEKSHRLVDDLDYMGMDRIVNLERKFKYARLAFDKIDIESQKFTVEYMMQKKGNKDKKMDQPIGKIPLSQLQLLLGDCGEPLPESRCKELMLYHLDHLEVSNAIGNRYKKMTFTRIRDELGEVDLEDTENVYKRGFLAWFMSGRPRDETNWLESFFIMMKNKAKRFTRDSIAIVDWFWRHISVGISRQVLTSQIFLPRKQETARYEGSLKIGKTDKMSNMLSMQVRFQSLENVKGARKRMQIPTTAGLAFTMDFMFKVDLHRATMQETCVLWKRFLAEHFEFEISKIPRFHSFQVYIAKSDIDNMNVMRTAIYFKNELNVDNVFRDLQLGFSLRDIIQELAIDLSCNIDPRTVAESDDLTINDNFALKCNGRISFCRGLISSVIHEVCSAIKEFHHKRDLDTDYALLSWKQAKRRTLHHNPLHNVMKLVRETFKYHFNLRPPIEEDIEEPGTGEGDNKTEDIKVTRSQPQDPELEELLNFNFVDETIPKLLQIAKWIGFMRQGNYDISFPDLYSFLFGNHFIRKYIPLWFEKFLIMEEGQMVKFLSKFRRKLSKEIEEVRERVDVYAAEQEAKKAAKLEAMGVDLEQLEKQKRLQKEKEDMMEKLKAMGITPENVKPSKVQEEEEEEEDDEDDGTRLYKLKKLNKEFVASQYNMLECFKAFADTITAFHSVYVTSSKYRFYIYTEGLEIFDTFLPMPVRKGPGDATNKNNKNKDNKEQAPFERYKKNTT